MHPAMYKLKSEGRMPNEFYSPEILSSSYITRHVFNLYNDIRAKNNQLGVEYRLAAKNPRNKINQADSLEIILTDQFNKDSTLLKQSGITTIDGEKYLYYSRPFLRVEQGCLKCHGRKDEAPKALQEYYHWEGGYNLKIGEITAIEILKTPIKAEYNTMWIIGLIIFVIASLLITLIILHANLSKRKNIIQSQNIEIEKNLTKLKETQNQLVQSEKMASLGVLTAGISHEINNPLNFINGAYLGLDNFFSKKEPQLREDVKVLLRGMETGIERVTTIVQGLDHFSRDTSDFNEPCDLHQIIDNCLLMLRNLYKDTITIEKHYTHDPLIINGNDGKLHQVFMNIITNAIQAIEDKGTIKIISKKEKHLISICIEDNGCGIEKELLPKVIEPFYTSKQPGEGTGLGLSISYNIIQDHKGTLDVESEFDNWTRVRITFKTKNDDR
jgi:signal transduction histidine kinase